MDGPMNVCRVIVSTQGCSELPLRGVSITDNTTTVSLQLVLDVRVQDLSKGMEYGPWRPRAYK